MRQQNLVPVAPQERIPTIDIIRGFALLGILIINFTVDSIDINLKDGLADQLVYWTVRVFMDDRFQAIYCFLFGLGFALQMQRAVARNTFFGFAYLRRMIALYLITIGVFILTGDGYPVLPHYAMTGVLLLFFWRVPLKILPFLALLFYLLSQTKDIIVNMRAEQKPVAIIKTNAVDTTLHMKVDSAILDKYVGVYQGAATTVFRRSNDSLFGVKAEAQFYLTPLTDTQFMRKDSNHIISFRKDSTAHFNIFVATVNGKQVPARRIQMDLQQALKGINKQKDISYAEFVKKNAIKYRNLQKRWGRVDMVLKQLGYMLGYILVLFLLGMYAGKRKIFHDVNSNKSFLRKVFKWGMVIGSPGIIFEIGYQAWKLINDIEFIHHSPVVRILINLPWDVGIILMAMAIIAGLTLILEDPVWKKRLSFFVPVGRLGLTNYILLLFANMIIFNNVSWFFGLKAGCFHRLLIGIAFFVILYFFSKSWLKYFRQGPFEWLWRSLTYLKFQPVRLKLTDPSG